MIWIFLVAFTLFTGAEGLYEGIDDITNNLATDLAPLITLFGEQATKQFLSESTSFMDSIIFSIAPLGLITAVVSVIRIYGNSSFKSIIGRSQEAHGVAEAELCSSTSQDVCELWSNGGICRVFGRPKILDFIYDTDIKDDFYPKYKKDRRQDIVEEWPSCGIYRPNTKKALSGWKEVESSRWTWPTLFKSLLRLFCIEPIEPNDQRTEEERRTEDEHTTEDKFRTEDEPSANPNLTLNIGIRKLHKSIHWSILIFSVLLQLSFFGYTTWATFYNPSFLNEGTPSPQAKLWFGLTISGTLMLVFGMILCARMIDLKSDERRFKRIGGTPKIFWLQPGGQRIGDQLFHAFAYSERRDEYITSGRVENPEQGRMLLLAVISTTSGWVLQFVGLRGSPGSIALFQFIATLIMSILRAALRGKRLGANNNHLETQALKEGNVIEGHELDWQAMNIDENDQHFEWRVSDHLPSEEQHGEEKEITKAGIVKSTAYVRAYYTRGDNLITQAANGASEWIAVQEAQNDPTGISSLNPGAKIMRFRSRLAELTGVQFGLPPEQAWGGKIRTTALQLQKALQVSAEYLFTQFPLGQAWKYNAAPKAIAWKSSCWFSRLPDQTSEEKPLPVGFQMYNRDGKWNISSYQLEAVLGLWSWSLKRSELLGPTTEEHLTRSKMVVVENSKREDIEAALYLWVTQTRNVRRYEGVGGIKRSDNLSIPTSLLFSKARSSEQSSRTPGQTHTPNTDEFTILGIPTDGSTSLLQFMAQDVYTVFINRIVDIVRVLCGAGDPEGYFKMRDHFLSTACQATPLFKFTNPHIDALANALVSAGLATREEALMSIVPAFLRQSKLPLLDEDMVQNLLDCAKSLRRELKFREGAALMTWMLYRSPVRFHKQILRCLGDLYRRAALSQKKRDQEFGLFGMECIGHNFYASLGCDHPWQTIDILESYERLHRFFCHYNIPKVPYEGSGAESYIESKGFSLGDLMEHGFTRFPVPIITDLDLALTLNLQFDLPSDVVSRGFEQLLGILRWAIGKNLPELIEDLWISAGLPKTTREYESSPLITALDLGCDLETFHSLLDWPGIDIDVNASESGLGDGSRNPLVCAIEANRADVVCSILRRGADVHQRDKLGITPLYCAFRKNNEGIIRLLLEAGADEVDVRDGRNRTALHFAAESNSEVFVQWLLKVGHDIQWPDDESRTALHFAAMANGGPVVRLLLKKGAEVHKKDRQGRTPIHVAAAVEGDNEEVICLLLVNGAQIHEKDAKGYTPLHLAVAEGGNKTGIQHLLKNGAGIHEKDNEGRTPLHLAVKYGRPRILRLLLEKSEEIGSVNDHEWSSLWSCVKNDREMAQLLEEKGIEKPLDDGGERGEEEEKGKEEGKYTMGR